jgi:hypothetical protein
MTWQAPAHPSTRQRLTVFAHPSLVTDASLKGGIGICDEVAFLRGIVNNDDITIVADGRELDWAKKPMSLELSDTVIPAGTVNVTPSPLRSTIMADAILACHKAGMQALAGYALVDAKFKAPRRFNAWLRSLHDGALSVKRDQEIERFATLISDWLDLDQDASGKGAFFDGISFDIETIGWWPVSEVTQQNRDDPTRAQQIGVVVSRFYTMLADMLRSKLAQGKRSQMVAVAGGGLIDRTNASHSFASGSTTLPGSFSAIAQPYQMADSRLNMVLRPMLYDNFEQKDLATKTLKDNTAVMDRWHKEVVDYALSENGVKGAGLARYHFQISIKTAPGPTNTGDDKDHNLDGVMTDPTWIRRRCGELHNRGVGLCIFAFGVDPGFWTNVATYDAALNPKASKPPVVSEPAQCPHDALSIKLVKP